MKTIILILIDCKEVDINASSLYRHVALRHMSLVESSIVFNVYFQQILFSLLSDIKSVWFKVPGVLLKNESNMSANAKCWSYTSCERSE